MGQQDLITGNFLKINMRNKPKYNIFKNSKYAVDGLIVAIKEEFSLKIEIFLLFIILSLLFVLDMHNIEKLILLITYFFIIISELLNSAIENTVDLVTEDENILAKKAKDIGASAVMVCVFLHILCWFIIIIK